MVDEFSLFARLPAPVRSSEDLGRLVADSVTMQEMARPDVNFKIYLPNQPVKLYCAARQIDQAMTNLLQNGLDAVDASTRNDKRIQVRIIEKNGGAWSIQVEDNGPGLPRKILDRLMEPYVTTRDKGTGLGLAIVKKIVEDHGGVVEIGDLPGGGARVTLSFPADATILEESKKPTGLHSVKFS